MNSLRIIGLSLASALTLAVATAPGAQAFTIDDAGPLDQRPFAQEYPMRAKSVDRPAAALSGTPLSGTEQDDDGHTLTWTLSGVSPAPSKLASTYDAVVKPGTTITFVGAASFATEKEGCTLFQEAWLGSESRGYKDSKEYDADAVSGGPNIMPFNLIIVVPETPPELKNTEPGDPYDVITARVTSHNRCFWGERGVDPKFYGSSIDLRIAVVAGSSDTEAPKVRLQANNKIYADVSKSRAKDFRNVARYPLKLRYSVRDNSGKAKVAARIFSDGAVVAGSNSKGYLKNGRYYVNVKRPPNGAGPFFWCVQASDKAGNRSKVTCKWLSLKVPITRANVNGCGTAGYGPELEWLQNYFGDVRTYGPITDRREVDLRNTCQIHDAAYSGVTIWDAFDKRYVDFRTWNRLKIDKKFRGDIRTMCRRALTGPDMASYRLTCQHGLTLSELIKTIPTQGLLYILDRTGANTYFDLVRSHGGVGFDANSTVPGTQPEKPSSTFPKGGARDNS